jgi:hypothetical protein
MFVEILPGGAAAEHSTYNFKALAKFPGTRWIVFFEINQEAVSQSGKAPPYIGDIESRSSPRPPKNIHIDESKPVHALLLHI